MTTRTQQFNPAELLEQAGRNYTNAVRNGFKMQEELATQWMEFCRNTTGTETMPQTFKDFFENTAPLAQQSADQAWKLIEQSTKRSMDLMTKAFDAGRCVNPADAQGKLERLWEESLSVLRENAQAMVQANARLMESWAEVAKSNLERVTPETTKSREKSR